MPARLDFDRPVNVQIGERSTVRTVRTVEGAREVLIDWPHGKRGPVYQATYKQIEAAAKGELTPAEARQAFADFAAHAGVSVD